MMTITNYLIYTTDKYERAQTIQSLLNTEDVLKMF